MEDAEPVRQVSPQEYLRLQYEGPPLTEEEMAAEVQRHSDEWQKMQASSSTPKPSEPS